MILRMRELVGFEAPCDICVLDALSEVCSWAAGLGQMPQKILLSGTVSRLIGTLSNNLEVFKSALAPLLSRGLLF
jgi:hypothetical protein